MKKRIGIDARLYSKTGVGVYIRNLLHHLSNISDEFQYFVYLMSEDVVGSEIKSNTFILRPAPYRWHSFSEQTKFLLQINSDNLDLMHFTYFSYPILYRRPFIATVHDTIILDHKTGKASTRSYPFYAIKHAIFRLVFGNQVAESKKIIVPTKYVAGRLVERYGKKIGNKIAVITEGVDYLLTESSKMNRGARKRDHFLYIGNFYPHKNVERLIRGFLDSRASLPLLLAGPEDYFYYKLFEITKKLDSNNRIRFVTSPDTDTVAKLYQSAAALIHPSLDEGFCLPLLEAAYFGIPVIASDIPVFHELLDNNYLPFNPQSTESITQAIEEYDNRSQKYSYGDILNHMTFEKMTQETLKIYRSLL